MQLNSLVSEVAQLRQLSTEAVELSSQLSDARSEMMGLSSKASAVQAELDKARSENMEAEDRIEALHKQVGMFFALLCIPGADDSYVTALVVLMLYCCRSRGLR